jgi:hypothetical protein
MISNAPPIFRDKITGFTLESFQRCVKYFFMMFERSLIFEDFVAKNAIEVVNRMKFSNVIFEIDDRKCFKVAVRAEDFKFAVRCFKMSIQ